MRSIVVDAGPMIALFNRSDVKHEKVKAWFARNTANTKLLCTEAVVTEVTHLLDFNVSLQTGFLRWARVALEVVPIATARYEEMAGWMDVYANVPMDFADATLLLLCLQNPGASLLTFDERGFGVFRTPGRTGKFPRRVEL